MASTRPIWRTLSSLTGSADIKTANTLPLTRYELIMPPTPKKNF